MNMHIRELPELITHNGEVYWFVARRGEKWHLMFRTSDGPLTGQGIYWTREAAIAAAYRYSSY